MSIDYTKYETVIGLEIHVQLNTLSKAYCSDSTLYGSAPNTHISPISLGHPGTLPVSNSKVLESAIKLGIALNCSIRERNEYARKNYFYADLPKGYQITQDKTPICDGGYINVSDKEGNPKRIDLTRIHMEEDAGKSIHDIDPFDSLIDLNRAGVPLLEIVTEPVLRSGEEAYSFVTEIRKLVRYLDICDGNMDEGSMRCDANISVRLKGETSLRNRVEVKNMNSIRNVQKAIELETKRQIEVYENQGEVDQETRNFNAAKNETSILRSKEDAHDYRYFPEPDLAPIIVKEQYINEIKADLPSLPEELFLKYTKEFGLSEYDARNLTDTKGIALYFEAILKTTAEYKMAANLVMGPIKSFLNEKAIEIDRFELEPYRIGELISLIKSGKISSSKASQDLFPLMLKHQELSPLQLADEHQLIQESDTDAILGFVKKAIAKYPEKALAYKEGKKNLLGLFMGEVMKLSKGKADPKSTNKLVREELEK
ncbi:Asp-tRNA(Asn)/Glu-tRNA(Gln) amidotransferase subunit GatB [Flavobacteriales bacterium]|nr:Asp-tRNA(Asn)/Glu-tRNA(Gln) amidotransferase subunit GatB [Flavobacteriales bacterium]MDG1145731.1 Asp-tRNA(Asn)/Glu-tRNA(Gln) amidotransferase subunit GatB [Flavobacteriales bacterium]